DFVGNPWEIRLAACPALRMIAVGCGEKAKPPIGRPSAPKRVFRGQEAGAERQACRDVEPFLKRFGRHSLTSARLRQSFERGALRQIGHEVRQGRMRRAIDCPWDDFAWLFSCGSSCS